MHIIRHRPKQSARKHVLQTGTALVKLMHKTHFWVRSCMLVLLLLSGVPAMADSRAVDSSNYEINFHSGDTSASGDRLSYYYAFAGRATFPLGQYLGVSLAINSANSTLVATPSNSTTSGQPWEGCGYHGVDYGMNLFARNPNFGRIGIGYSANRLTSQCSATFIADGSDTLKTDTYNTNAEYYFSRVTLAAAWSQTNITNSSDVTTDTLTASWYPSDLTRLSIAASGLDLKDTYSVELEYQPEFLDNLIGVRLSFTSQQQTIKTQSIMVGVSYYFGKNADLITRDREYR